MIRIKPRDFVLLILLIYTIPANTQYCRGYRRDGVTYQICFIRNSGLLTYNQGNGIAASLNARYPYESELRSMISINGFGTNNNFVYPYVKFTPVLDRNNEWMAIGPIDFGVLHCSVVCPQWGDSAIYGQWKEDFGMLCLD
jgi:hypothetical protein